MVVGKQVYREERKMGKMTVDGWDDDAEVNSGEVA